MEYADGDCADSAEAHPGFYCKVALQLLIALYSGALYFKSPSTRMSRDAYGLDGVRCMPRRIFVGGLQYVEPEFGD